MLEAKNQLGTIILIFITIIVGVALISALGDELYEAVNVYSRDNDSIDTANQKQSPFQQQRISLLDYLI